MRWRVDVFDPKCDVLGGQYAQYTSLVCAKRLSRATPCCARSFDYVDDFRVTPLGSRRFSQRCSVRL